MANAYSEMQPVVIHLQNHTNRLQKKFGWVARTGEEEDKMFFTQLLLSFEYYQYFDPLCITKIHKKILC